MLVVDRNSKSITHSTVSKIGEFLPQETAIVINNTKVIKARIFGHKRSGGKVECIIVKPLTDTSFLALVRGKVKAGDRLFFDSLLEARVEELLEDGSRVISFFKNEDALTFETLISILDNIGHIPLPPYIKREDNASDERDYQSRFAKNFGSVAAPTASLHFDEELLERLKGRFEFLELTLHVGLGTFKSVEAKSIDAHKMHSEQFSISQKTAQVIESQKKLLCIGTTSARTVEYYHKTKKLSGECDIFINPANPPKRVDMLLTNFHLPYSTLIMLVSSFLGLEQTLEIYEEAKREGYRFFSYGDAMLIL